MNPRPFFLLTALSGMVGMLALIALNLIRFWIENSSPDLLSDEGIDRLILLTRAAAITKIVGMAAVAAFVVFFVLYLVARSETRTPARD